LFIFWKHSETPDVFGHACISASLWLNGVLLKMLSWLYPLAGL